MFLRSEREQELAAALRDSKMVKRMRRVRVKHPTVRLTITFCDPAIHWLEQEAANRAISIADLIRRIVDETRGSYIVEAKPKGCDR